MQNVSLGIDTIDFPVCWQKCKHWCSALFVERIKRVCFHNLQVLFHPKALRTSIKSRNSSTDIKVWTQFVDVSNFISFQLDENVKTAKSCDGNSIVSPAEGFSDVDIKIYGVCRTNKCLQRLHKSRIFIFHFTSFENNSNPRTVIQLSLVELVNYLIPL